jgi:hypothetical protein
MSDIEQPGHEVSRLSRRMKAVEALLQEKGIMSVPEKRQKKAEAATKPAKPLRKRYIPGGPITNKWQLADARRKGALMKI